MSTQGRMLAVVLASFGAMSCEKRQEAARVEQEGPEALTPTPEVWLQVQAFQIPANTFANPAPITMWGYNKCFPNFVDCGTPTVPGPQLVLLEGQSLIVHLRNALTGPYVEPVSMVIPGQTQAMTPVWIDPVTQTVTATGARPAGDYTSRVRSFTAETPPDNSTVVTYVWNTPKPGTYLYESGTHPALQVQMGLYGALTVYSAANRAYASELSRFTSEALLLFSELDPELHAAVAAGTYGPNPNAPAAPPAGWLTSTIGYHPSYFLINGRSWSPTNPPIGGGAPGQPMLLRFLNAGLETKVPTVNGPYMSVIAEDGNFINVTTPAGAVMAAPRSQYSVMLPAGKTVDAIFVPVGRGDVALYDRRLNLTNAGVSPGGQFAYLTASGPGALVLVAFPDVLFFATPSGTSQTRNLTFRNLGLAPRIVRNPRVAPLSASASSASALQWTFVPTSLTIPPGADVNMAVTFTPSSLPWASWTLTFDTDDPAAPTLTITLMGVSW